jgi:hypothetical protein
MSAASLRSLRSCSSGGRNRQRPSSNARRADATARSTSAADPAAAVAACSPVAGSMTGIVVPSSDGTTSPSITWPNKGRASCPAAAALIGYVEKSVVTLMGCSSAFLSSRKTSGVG